MCEYARDFLSGREREVGIFCPDPCRVESITRRTFVSMATGNVDRELILWAGFNWKQTVRTLIRLSLMTSIVACNHCHLQPPSTPKDGVHELMKNSSSLVWVVRACVCVSVCVCVCLCYYLLVLIRFLDLLHVHFSFFWIFSLSHRTVKLKIPALIFTGW